MVLNTQDKETAEAIACGWRGIAAQAGGGRLVPSKVRERLPSGIGDRTLLAYEHGIRHLTAVRLIELSEELRVDAPTSWVRHFSGLTLHTLRRASTCANSQNHHARIRPLHQWAKNRMNDTRTASSR